MKVFVSGQIGDVENVRKVQDAVIAAGHKITHDWTRNETGDKLLSGDGAKLDDLAETSNRAVLDINGVMDADLYIGVTTNMKPGKGMYVELGAAIAKPNNRVCLVGPLNNMSIFYFHPRVERYETIEKLLASL